MGLDELRRHAESRLETRIALSSPYKVCDLKPAVGRIWEAELAGYEFWGHSDLDIIWGDIQRFIPQGAIDSAHVISSRAGKTSGHFTLYRNDPAVNDYFKEETRWREFLAHDGPVYFDEVSMTRVVRHLAEAGRAKVFWPGLPFNFAVGQRRHLPRSYIPPVRNAWMWERGHMYHLSQPNRAEIMYLHFMTWKGSLRHCDVNAAAFPERFWVSYTDISVAKRSRAPQSSAETLRGWMTAVKPIAHWVVGALRQMHHDGERS